MADQEDDSVLLHKGPCDFCGSSDARAVYSDGHSFCYACPEGDAWKPGDGEYTPNAARSSKDRAEGTIAMSEKQGRFQSLIKRGLMEEVCKQYGYWVGTFSGESKQVANYYDMDRNLVAQKVRDRNKEFFILGKMPKDGLFGKHLWTGGKKIVVTEGEIDCLTVAQIQGGKYPVVSIPRGLRMPRRYVLPTLSTSTSSTRSF